MEMFSLMNYQQCFLMDLLPPPPPIPKATQIECDEGENKLSLRWPIAEYHMAEQKPKIGTLSMKYSISHFTL